MKNVLVTGSEGFIGKNLVAALRQLKEINILEFDVNKKPDKLPEFAEKADFIYHLAGINRPKNESEFKKGNTDLTKSLTVLLAKNNKQVPIVFTSSIQAALKNAYGISKKNAEKLLQDYSKKTKSRVFIYRLPNVFGKWCRPNYNSAVATFCYNISHDLPVSISDEKKKLELVYIDDVVEDFLKLLEFKGASSGKILKIKRTFNITLGELVKRIYILKDIRTTLIIPDLSDDFTRFLYATYLSYLDKEDFAFIVAQNKDNRGSLAELFKSRQFGQVFISKSNKGVVRGKHFHNTKIEKFCVIKGRAVIKFRHILSNEVISYDVSGKEIKIVDIPPGYTHSIENSGEEELFVVFWASSIFDPDKPDTFSCNVEN